MKDVREINYLLPHGDRTFIRSTLIRTFLNEIPGTGKGKNASRYRYNVEMFKNYSIFLKRPTRLNKGFDFTVNIEGLYFKKKKRYSNPSHIDIFNVLLDCKNNYPNIYPNIKATINDIYNCQCKVILKSNTYFHDYEGNLHPIEIILLALKWLFIEQDCAYWNYSGRATLFHELIKRGLA